MYIYVYIILIILSFNYVYTAESSASWSISNITLPLGAKLLNIPPRYMWGWFGNTAGYCGETSVQSALLYYGNYVSQEHIFNANSGEFLIGVNDAAAISKMGLNYVQWSSSQSQPQAVPFSNWIKAQIDSGSPVIAGFYSDVLSDADYDHIMPIIGYQYSNNAVTGLYYNTLQYNEVQLTTTPYSSARNNFLNGNGNPVRYRIPRNVDYGVSVTGNKYPGISAQFFKDTWDEPDWGSVDNINAKPIAMNGTLVVSTLEAYKNYSCVRYDSIGKLPTSTNFLSSGTYSKRYIFNSTTSVYSIFINGLMSNGTYFFRCFLDPVQPTTIAPTVAPTPTTLSPTVPSATTPTPTIPSVNTPSPTTPTPTTLSPTTSFSTFPPVTLAPASFYLSLPTYNTYFIGSMLPIRWNYTGSSIISTITLEGLNNYFIGRDVSSSKLANSWLIPMNLNPGSYYISLKVGSIYFNSTIFNITIPEMITKNIIITYPSIGQILVKSHISKFEWLYNGFDSTNILTISLLDFNSSKIFNLSCTSIVTDMKKECLINLSAGVYLVVVSTSGYSYMGSFIYITEDSSTLTNPPEMVDLNNSVISLQLNLSLALDISLFNSNNTYFYESLSTDLAPILNVDKSQIYFSTIYGGSTIVSLIVPVCKKNFCKLSKPQQYDIFNAMQLTFKKAYADTKSKLYSGILTSSLMDYVTGQVSAILCNGQYIKGETCAVKATTTDSSSSSSVALSGTALYAVIGVILFVIALILIILYFYFFRKKKAPLSTSIQLVNSLQKPSYTPNIANNMYTPTQESNNYSHGFENSNGVLANNNHILENSQPNFVYTSNSNSTNNIRITNHSSIEQVKMLATRLPAGWIQYLDDHDQVFFYNQFTGLSQWDRPT